MLVTGWTCRLAVVHIAVLFFCNLHDTWCVCGALSYTGTLWSSLRCMWGRRVWAAVCYHVNGWSCGNTCYKAYGASKDSPSVIAKAF